MIINEFYLNVCSKLYYSLNTDVIHYGDLSMSSVKSVNLTFCGDDLTHGRWQSLQMIVACWAAILDLGPGCQNANVEQIF